MKTHIRIRNETVSLNHHKAIISNYAKSVDKVGNRTEQKETINFLKALLEPHCITGCIKIYQEVLR